MAEKNVYSANNISAIKTKYKNVTVTTISMKSIHNNSKNHNSSAASSFGKTTNSY